MEKSLFNTRFEGALLRQGAEARLALLFITVRNEAGGSAPAGDTVRGEVARRLHCCVEEDDAVVRLNSGEFMAVLTGVKGREQAAEVARTMLGQLTQPYVLAQRPAQLTCSIGIALCPEHGTSFMALARSAVAALYRARGAEGSTFRFHSPG